MQWSNTTKSLSLAFYLQSRTFKVTDKQMYGVNIKVVLFSLSGFVSLNAACGPTTVVKKQITVSYNGVDYDCNIKDCITAAIHTVSNLPLCKNNQLRVGVLHTTLIPLAS